MLYRIYDHGAYETLEASSIEEAARKYAELLRAEYACESTYWVTVHVQPIDPSGHSTSVRVQVDPEEPTCREDSHAWVREADVGHGGGVMMVDLCAHCGVRRTIDTWAQDPCTGQQGLKSITYR